MSSSSFFPSQIELYKLIDSLHLMADSLLRIVLSYLQLRWESFPARIWSIEGIPMGLSTTSDSKTLFISNAFNYILTYSLQQTHNIDEDNDPEYQPHQKLPSNPFFRSPYFNYPSSIDLDQENYVLYVMERNKVSIMDFEGRIKSSWVLPGDHGGGWGLKLDNKQNTLYYTLTSTHQIFMTSKNGKKLVAFGNGQPSEVAGQYHSPHGLTLDSTHLYVCDTNNNRIQVVNKLTGESHACWGNGLTLPMSIFLYQQHTHLNDEDIFILVGDLFSIQIFNKLGIFFQKIESKVNQSQQKLNVFGVIVINDNLFISDSQNRRIKMFRRS